MGVRRSAGKIPAASRPQGKFTGPSTRWYRHGDEPLTKNRRPQKGPILLASHRGTRGEQSVVIHHHSLGTSVVFGFLWFLCNELPMRNPSTANHRCKRAAGSVPRLNVDKRLQRIMPSRMGDCWQQAPGLNERPVTRSRFVFWFLSFLCQALFSADFSFTNVAAGFFV